MPLSDANRTERMTAQRVSGVIRLYAYVPALAAMLPMTLMQAAAGRPERLMAQTAMMESLVGEQLDLGLQLAVACTEDAPLLERLPAGRETLLGEDFVGASGRITIPEGGLSYWDAEVMVLGDDDFEGDEYFKVIIEDVDGASLATPVSKVVIRDDDARTGGPAQKQQAP